mgnify:CR=1 FL=1
MTPTLHMILNCIATLAAAIFVWPTFRELWIEWGTLGRERYVIAGILCFLLFVIVCGIWL